MKKRIALAGLGRAAQTIHLPAYARVKRLQIVGGCDPATPPGRYRFPLFASAQEMLHRTRPDILAVLTPSASHYQLVRLGLQAGCHVFCEKPLVQSIEEAEDIIALADAAGRRVVVNQEYRFMNIHQAAKKAIGTPEFGELIFLKAEQTFFVTGETEAGWRGQEQRRTCQEFGIHVFDLCRFFFAAEPLGISARMPKRNGSAADYLNLIQIDFPGDRAAQIILDRECRGRHRYLQLRLDGSHGCVESQIGGTAEVRAGIKGRSYWPYFQFELTPGGSAQLFHGERGKKIATDPLDIFVQATRRLVEAFLDALERDAKPPCSAVDNIKSLACVWAAYESAGARNQWYQ